MGTTGPPHPTGVASRSPEHQDKCVGEGEGTVSHSHMTYLLAQVPALETVSQEEGPSVFQTASSGPLGRGQVCLQG